MYNDVVKFIQACDQEQTTEKVIKQVDGKVMKPEGWTPPELEQFIKK